MAAQHASTAPAAAAGGGGSGPGQFGDTTFTKVFVGGLAWETQSESLRRYFEQFGDILEGVVITDKHTGRSKGYGFVSLLNQLALLCIYISLSFILTKETAFVLTFSFLSCALILTVFLGNSLCLIDSLFCLLGCVVLC